MGENTAKLGKSLLRGAISAVIVSCHDCTMFSEKNALRTHATRLSENYFFSKSFLALKLAYNT